MALGTIFVELDLSLDKWNKSTQQVLARSKSASEFMEANWRTLGSKSDTIFQAMANSAILAYEKISTGAKLSAEAQFRAQSGMLGKIQAANIQMAQNPLFKTLGIKSEAMIKAQQKAVMQSYDAIKKSKVATSQDLVNIERAKNRKLKELNREMVGDHRVSMASMTRAVLRFYAAWFVASNAARVAIGIVGSGIRAIDELKVSTIAIAAQITSMQGPENVTENFKQNVIYAKELNIELQRADALSFANLSQIQMMNRAMVNQGVLLDANNEKQMESFIALSNAVAMFTQGQDKTKQASQEIRALFTGQIRAGDMVARQIDSLIKKEGKYAGGLKEVVKLGKEHNDTLERMQPYLIGIIEASGDIMMTWEAVSSSLETSWSIIQRGLFKNVYKDITEAGRKFTEDLKNNEKAIIKSVNNIATAFKLATAAAVTFGLTILALRYAPALYVALEASIMAVGNAFLFGGGTAAVWNFMHSGSILKTISTLKGAFLGLFGVFTAGFAGASLGTWLSDNFEIARQAGLNLLYSLISGWDAFLLSAKSVFSFVSEKAQTVFFLFQGKFDAASRVEAEGAFERRVLKIEYEKTKTMREEWLLEQRLAVTDDAIASAKALKDAQKKAGLSDIGGGSAGSDDPAKSAIRIMNLRLQELRKAYQAEIDMASHTSRMKILQGENELAGVLENLDTKKAALDKWFTLSSKTIDETIKKEEVKDARLSVLQADYQVKSQGLENKRAEAVVRIANENMKTRHGYITWDQKQQEDALEFAQRKGGEIVAVSGSTWDKILEYQMLTGEKITNDQIANIDLLISEYWGMAEELESFYSQIRGYEDVAHKHRLEQIELERKANAQKFDEEAANALAKQQIGDADQKLFEAKTAQIDDGISQMHSAFSSIASMYDKSSSQYKQMQSAAQAMILIQKGIAAVEAVRAVLTQGTGDPYSAFVRMATMAAAVGSLLGSVGIGFSGTTAYGNEGVKLSTGETVDVLYGKRTTIFGGENEAISESLSNSLSILEDTYDLQSRTLTGIHENMKQLNANITGIVRGVIRGEGQFGVAFGAGFGEKSNFPEDLITGGNIINDIGKNLGFLWDFSVNAVTAVADFFFGTTKTYAEAAGLIVDPKSQTARPFTDIYEKDSGAFWGLIGGGESRYTREGANDAIMANLFFGPNGVYPAFVDGITAMVDVIGGDIEKLVLEGFKVDFKDKTLDEIEAELAGVISEIGDKAAREVFGNLITLYAQVNEGALETATRLVRDKLLVLEMLDMVGLAFEATARAGVELSQTLIEISGGLEALAESTLFYYDKFFTDAEKQIRTYEFLSDVMSDHLKILPETRDEYRLMIEALDLTTISGQEAYVALIQAAGAADEYYAYVEKMEEKRKNQAESFVALFASLSGIRNPQQMSMEAILGRYDRSMEEFNALDPLEVDYYDNALDILTKQVGFIEDLTKLSKDQVVQADRINDTLKSMLDSMSFGSLAPTDNFAAQQVRLGELLGTLGTETDLAVLDKAATALNALLPSFLDYAQGYGLDYNQVVSSLVPIIDTAMARVDALKEAALDVGDQEGLETASLIAGIIDDLGGTTSLLDEAAQELLEAARRFNGLSDQFGGMYKGEGDQGESGQGLVGAIIEGLAPILYDAINSGGGDGQVFQLVIDGKVVGDIVAEQTIKNPNMVKSIRKIVPNFSGGRRIP